MDHARDRVSTRNRGRRSPARPARPIGGRPPPGGSPSHGPRDDAVAAAAADRHGPGRDLPRGPGRRADLRQPPTRRDHRRHHDRAQRPARLPRPRRRPRARADGVGDRVGRTSRRARHLPDPSPPRRRAALGARRCAAVARHRRRGRELGGVGVGRDRRDALGRCAAALFGDPRSDVRPCRHGRHEGPLHLCQRRRSRAVRHQPRRPAADDARDRRLCQVGATQVPRRCTADRKPVRRMARRDRPAHARRQRSPGVSSRRRTPSRRRLDRVLQLDHPRPVRTPRVGRATRTGRDVRRPHRVTQPQRADGRARRSHRRDVRQHLASRAVAARPRPLQAGQRLVRARLRRLDAAAGYPTTARNSRRW